MDKNKINLIIAMLIYGSIGIFVKKLSVTSSQISFVRGVIGSIFLFIYGFVITKNISFKRIKKNIIILIPLGIALGANWTFLFEAYKYTTVSTATICYYMAPVIVMILSFFLLKEKITLKKILCIIGAVIGMVLITGSGSLSFQKGELMGIFYGLVAAVLYAFIVIFNKFLKDISGVERTLVQLFISAVVMGVYVFFTDGFSNFYSLSVKSVDFFVLLILGVVHTGFAYLLYFTSIGNLKSQTAAVLSYLDPVSAIIFASVFLNEEMSFIQIVGALLVLLSTIIGETNINLKRNKYKKTESV